jgi:histidinol phosphatase-like enzyme
LANIFSLFGTIFIDNKEADKKIDETTQKGESAGSKIGKAFGSIGKAAVAVGTATVAAAGTVGAATYKMASSTSQHADEIDKMSQKLGMSKKSYQEWDYVLSQAGVDITSMSTGLKTLTNKLDDAKNGSKSAQEMFTKLGISAEEALIVGDGMADLNVSKNAEIEFVPVGYGYTKGEKLFANCGIEPCQTVAQLREKLLSYFPAKI